MNRIDSLFQKLKKNQQKALIAYLVAGDPHLDATIEYVHALENAGVDLIELGVPFSDPLADGVVNQLACQRSLASATNLHGILESVKKIRKFSQIPLILFSYYNPIFKYSLAKLLQDAEAAGIDGLLILDLPPEEIASAWSSTSLKRIPLIAPTTPSERISEIVKTSGGFIYYVSREGVTGMQNQIAQNLTTQIQTIRKCSPLPICVGFGISNSQQAQQVAEVADGVVIGSAIVNFISKLDFLKSPSQASKELENFVRPFGEVIHITESVT
jgi:tryptophan synthase alpha chain